MKTKTFGQVKNTSTCSRLKVNYKKQRGWKQATFTREQVEILKGKNTNLYRVIQDPNVDTVYSIELKPVESVFLQIPDF